MKLNELIEKLENLSGYGSRDYIERNEILNLVEQLDELKPVKVPQFVADWIDYFKKTGDWDLFQAMDYLFGKKEIREWLEYKNNQETFARAWLDGYKVEEEKRYEVILCNGQSLKTVYRQGGDHLDFEMVYGDLESFTRKRLEEAGFGWVFDCPGVQVEEVE